MLRNGIQAALGVGLVLLHGTGAIGQSVPTGAFIGPFSNEPRFNAPFSAHATLRIVQRTENGGQVDPTFTTTHFRDSLGRVRIEYAVGADSDGPRAMVLLVPNPYAPKDRVFLIDDVERLIEWVDAGIVARLFNASTAFSIPTGLRRFTVFLGANVHAPENTGILEDLGSRTVAGLEATGLRFSANLSGDVDERWESADIGMVVYARHTDSRTELEYTLRDVRRTEPDHAIFLLPADYRYKHDGTVVLDSPIAELRRLRDGGVK